MNKYRALVFTFIVVGVLIINFCNTHTKHQMDDLDSRMDIITQSQVTTTTTEDVISTVIPPKKVANESTTISNKTTTTSQTQKETKSTTETTNPITTNTQEITTSPTATTITETEYVETYETTTESYNTYDFNVPTGKTNFFAYMDYRKITTLSSTQYQLQQTAWTDSQGLRRIGDDICIALGSYYGTNLGSRYLITLDTGNSYTAVLADCKADIHTDANNQYTPAVYGEYKNVIEFIVDVNSLDHSIKQSGNIGTYSNMSGNVVSIEQIY